MKIGKETKKCIASHSRWWLFRSWGRIGTTIGNNKLESKEDLQDAIAHFEELYEEKTGNRFSAKEFNKVPGCWYPLDIDYGQVSAGPWGLQCI